MKKESREYIMTARKSAHSTENTTNKKEEEEVNLIC